jgi:hypothetical protein
VASEPAAGATHLGEPFGTAALRRHDQDRDDPDLAQAALGLLYRLAGGAR